MRRWRVPPAAETDIDAFKGTIMPRTHWRRLTVRTFFFVLAFGLGGACDARDKACSPKDAAAADAAVDGLDSWAKVERASKKYGHCDDGSIAEGNSEAVARLLVDHWPTLPLLADLVKRDPALKKFILRHIDSTLDTNDLSRISELASTQCPSGSAPLCRELSQAAARASK
jgi:hypothetical protein